MCGICGFTNQGNNPQDILNKMMKSISHRGPDGSGQFIENNSIALGHQRLSIIDLSTGKQPIFNETKDKQIVFNGEIYNYKELKKDLEQKGHRFYTNSDSETIIHLYEQYGYDCLKYLRGMFAFAIWDSKIKSLFIARDRLGIKPLYYTFLGDSFIFASEIKALLLYPGVKTEIDFEALDQFLTFRFTPNPYTMIKGVKKLQPAHYAVVNNKNFDSKLYWDPDRVTANKVSSKDFNDVFADVTKYHMVSDVPVGVYLSGGLDSSYITGMASKISEEKVKTFSVGFENSEFNELPWAKLVADFNNTDHKPLIVNKSNIDILPEIIWHLDEPLADNATIPTYLMAEETHKHIKVVLTGEGSDELFAGYDKYKYLMILERLRKASVNYNFKFKNSSLAKRFFSSIGAGSRIELVENFVSVFSKSEKQELYGGNIKNLETNNYIESYFKDEKNSFIDQLLWFDIKTWLPDDLLLKNDKMTMAHSVEGRVPFLDHKFVEMALKIPSSQKISYSGNKQILRNAMESVVPREIINRKKQGFTVPFDDWFSKGNVLTDNMGSLKKRNIFNNLFINKLLNSKMDVYKRRQLTTLLYLEIWLQQFIDGKTRH